MAEALYRKYRPQIFEDVVGQEHIERTIKNAIEQDKVSHAYLFTGPRGTGKTTTARLLAKALLCEKGPTANPDGTCEDCTMIANGEHPDVYELDAASRTGVENVREEIIGRVQFAPTRGRYKVYIIDEVHMLSPAAFNALLKTLEEPPSHVVFILATTDPQKVPETIHSRCQRFDFRRISSEAIVSRLGAICVSEDVEFEGEALDLIAHRAEGGMRNALTSLEQLIAFGEGKVTMEVAERMLGGIDSNDLAEIVRAIGTRDVAACFRWTADYVETGADLAQFVRDLAEHIRNMYVLSLAGADVALEVSDATRRELTSELQWFAPDRLSRLLGVLGDLSSELKTSTNPRLSFEIALTRMVRPDSDLTIEALAERVEALESGYSAVAHVSSAASVSEGVAAMPADGQPATQEAQPVQAVAPAAQGSIQGVQSADDVRTSQSVRTASETQVHATSVQVEPALSAAQPAQQTESTKVAESAAAAPSSAGGVSAELAASLVNPAALQRIWQSALAALKKNKAAYGVLFLNTKALYDERQALLSIDFPVENAFAFKAVQKPDVQDAVLQALRQACGAELPFRYTQGSSVAAAGPLSATASASTAAEPSGSAQVQSVSAAVAQPVASAARPAAQPAAQPEVQPSAQPASTAPTETDSRPQFASVPPEPDLPPVDTYDLPPYDEPVPYDDGFNPAAQPGSQLQSASTPQVQPASTDVPVVDAASSLPPEPADATTSPTVDASAPAESPEDLQAILAAGFGDGVVVQEVRE